MMGLGQTHSCRDLFKKLEILPIPCVYLLSLMTFVVNNCDKFLLNNSIYTIGTRNNDHFHAPVSRLLSYQRVVYYSGIKLFNVLPNSISMLRTDKNQFKIALKRYLQRSTFYCIDEFIEHARCTKIEGE
jgi:SNF2 family DNA or RNA helicase